MAVYFVTGVSRGIGYGALAVLTEDPANTVIGMVRDKADTIKKISADPEIKDRKIHIVEGDLNSYESLQKCASEVAKITGGAIDYLIANAGYISLFDNFEGIDALAPKPKELEDDLNRSLQANIVGQIHLFNLFLPLVLKGKTKKVIHVSTAFADVEFTAQHDIENAPLYSISKAAMNLAVAKYSAVYKKDGVLFISVAPGSVEVGRYNESPPEQMQKLGGLMGKLMAYQPNFTGPSTPQGAVRDMKAVWEKATPRRMAVLPYRSLETSNGFEF